MPESCPPHWWIIDNNHVYFTRGDHGDLIEEAQMKCKHCSMERINVCVIPSEVITLPHTTEGYSSYDGVER